MTETETGRYLYAVGRGLDPQALAGVAALAGGRLEVVEHRGLSAVVSTVDLAEYGEDGLRRNLEDMAWLEQVARGHDDVVRAAAALAPTAPLRLATICLDDDGVRRRLDEWHDDLVAVLDRVEGRAEWSVKVFAMPRPAREPAAAQPAAVSGAAYLQRKKAEQQARLSDQTGSQRIADEIHERLADRSVAGRRLAAQDPRLTGRAEAMLHNGAYLVEADEGEAFASLARELAAAHPDVVVECQGPWPPYSFATLEQS